MTTRRDMLRLLCAAACMPLCTGRAFAGEPARYVAARRRDGAFEAAVIDAHGIDLRHVALPDRGHSFAIDRARNRAVAFGRQPGFYALAFDLDGGAATPLPLAEGRHHFGHGTFDADGTLLFAAEQEYESGRGVLGVYDASAPDWRRVGEFDCHGIGPHEAVLLPDRRTLCVAVGGILIHPDYDKRELNLDSMAPSLVYLDLEGRLLEQVSLAPDLHKLSIRHLAVDAGGAVWFGCQHRGPETERPALVGRHRRGNAPELFAAPPELQRRFRNYIGSVSVDRAGSVVATSSPVGGVIAYWDASSGRCIGHTELMDGCGVAPLDDGRFIESNGHGAVVASSPNGRTKELLAPSSQIAWDNHLRRV